MYRHFAPTYQALSGDGARLFGGRWNPSESFGVVYAAVDVPTVDREFRRAAAMSRMSRLLPRNLAEIRLDLKKVLDLTRPEVREMLQVSVDDITGDDLTLPRAIGEAAHHLGIEAIVAPSAAGEGVMVAVFIGNRVAESVIEVVSVGRYRLNDDV